MLGIRRIYVIIVFAIICVLTWLSMGALIFFGDANVTPTLPGTIIIEGIFLVSFMITTLLVIWNDIDNCYGYLDEDVPD